VSKLKVDFEPPENGSIKFTIAVGEQAVSDFATHIYPSLTQLCIALCSFAEGRAQAATFLLGAPEYDVCFEPRPEPALSKFRVELYPGMSRERGIEPETILEYVGTVSQIVLPFWRALRALESSLSDEEFRSGWGADFPKLEMASLTRHVDRLKVKDGV
jgi:hypothetical protein